MERLGLSSYGYFANVDGRKMEFVNEYELDEYVEEPSEESESSFIFSQKKTSYFFEVSFGIILIF